MHSMGWGLLGLASVASLLSAVTWDHEVRAVDCSVYGCKQETPDNTFPAVMLVTAAALSVPGVLMVAQSEETKTEVVSSDDHSFSVRKSCFTGDDLEELVVVARDDRGRVWPVRLTSTNEVRIPGPGLPSGGELELVVYRAPRHHGGVYRKGVVLDRFSLPANATSASPSP
jgi:hypothetical protein